MTWAGLDLGSDGLPTIQNQGLTGASFGLRKFNVVTGTGNFAGLRLGQQGFFSTGVVNDIPVSAGITYRAVIWVRGISGYSGVNFVFQAFTQTFTLRGQKTSIALTSDWVRHEFTFTTQSGDNFIALYFVKGNNATNVTFEASGLMLVTGTSPAGFNAGSTSDLYENTTDRVTLANWFLGMRGPYRDWADDSMLSLTLDNNDKRFSPEYASSPLFGKLVPYRPIRVRSNDGTNERSHWVGWVERIQPSVNANGKRICEITAAGPMLFFQAAETKLALQENLRTDEIIAKLIQEVVIPPSLSGAWLLGRSGNSEVGRSTWLANTASFSVLDQGKTTLAIAADNWVNQGGLADKEQDTFDVYRAIKDVTAAERGRFFFDREGRAVFWNRHRLLDDNPTAATFDNAMTDLVYTYGALDELKNEIVVICHPRAAGPVDEVLWGLNRRVGVAPGKTKTLNVKYRDINGNSRVGARDVTVSDIILEKGSLSITLDAGATSAELKLTNTGTGRAILKACSVRGQKVTDYGQMEATASDTLSIADYGRRTLRLNLPSIDDLEYAESIALFEQYRRSQPRGSAMAITLTSHGKDGGGQHAHQLARTLGDRITVKEAQTGHDASYYIVGEAHKLSGGAALFETTWYLEPAPKAPYPWKLGVASRSNVGSSTYLTL